MHLSIRTWMILENLHLIKTLLYDNVFSPPAPVSPSVFAVVCQNKEVLCELRVNLSALHAADLTASVRLSRKGLLY